jgi:hypothetical protein
MEGKSSHILDLAKELIDDIELSRLSAEQLLLKATRLARLVGDDETYKWLGYELNGYSNDPDARKWMLVFGRLDSADAQYGYCQPLASISGTITAMQAQIQQLRVPDIQFAPSSSNPQESVTGFAGLTATSMTKPAKDVLDRLQALTTAITNITGVRSRVLNAIHNFVIREYYNRAFTGLAESIFERHKTTIDELLRISADEVLKKIPAIYDRLAAGDQEAISQALNSVRRMIKAFADSVYPPGVGSVELNGTSYSIGTDKVLNRIKLFLNSKCTSSSRCERLNKTIRQIHERASAGTHSDVMPDEARALFLHTYLVLGEILFASSIGEIDITHKT